VRILFAGKQHFDIGGIETSTDQLARRLLARGHEVTVLASPAVGSKSRTRRLEQVSGYPYPAFAAHAMPPADAFAAVQRRFRADAVIVNAGGRWYHDWTRPLVAAARELPTILYICDREAVKLIARREVEPDVVWTVADSHTALVLTLCSLPVLTVPSLVEPDLYRTDPSGEVVLYVNPVKSKGVRTAISLAAARRDIPFVFLRAWAWSDAKFAELNTMAAALGNVEVLRPTPDPRIHYARARVLLAPYIDFNRPRTIAEAQLSGIPTLSLEEEGNREAVGGGGILVPPDAPLADWAGALGSIWDDPAEHRRLSSAALAHSRRPEMQPEAIVELVETQLSAAITRFRARAELLADRPSLVSVVVPVRNGADTIDEQLAALAGQTYTGPWELIVSDNGSSDGTRGRVAAWEGGLSAEIRIVDSSARRGVAHARNVGIREARGSCVLICDADDVVSPEWMKQMVGALQDHEIVTGLGDRARLNRPDQYAWMGEPTTPETPIYGHRHHASGGNMGVHRDVALELGGFDETLLRAEDVDWSWRAQDAGHEIWCESAAVNHLRLSDELWATARRFFRGGYAEPALYRRHRAHGMPKQPREEIVAEWRWLLANARTARNEPELRYRWTANAALRLGRLAGSLRHRVAFL
jgi:GT2 family glycosyltransferase/glycosyltransferase involved in cell wall biosynthesis